MSMSESSIGSTGAGAAPPSAPPAAPSVDSAPQPAAVDVAPATPAVAGPAAQPTDVAAPVTPGAPTSEEGATGFQSLDDVFAKYRQDKAAAPNQEAAQTSEPAPREAPPVTPEPVAPPLEAAETPQPVVEEPPVEQPPVVAQETADTTEDLDLETVLTAEDVNTRFARKLSQKERAEIAKREAHRGELLKTVNELGNPEHAKALSDIIWKQNPTEQDAEALMDLLLLPEHAHAIELGQQLGQHFVKTAINHEETGKEFANTLISDEWGNRPADAQYGTPGAPYDVDFIAKAVAADKAGLINWEFIESELQGASKPAEPTAKELELQRKVEELSAGKATEDEANARKTAEMTAVYNTQANTFVSNFLMSAVIPLAQKANWAPSEGESPEQAAEKKVLGDLVTSYCNERFRSDTDYEEAQKMIKNMTAFHPQTGQATPRFLRTLSPLQNKAKAMFNELQRTLNGRFKFAAQDSRNARLVQNNGSKGAAPVAQTPPPLAAPPARQDGPKTVAELMEEAKAPYRAARAAQEQGQRVGRL